MCESYSILVVNIQTRTTVHARVAAFEILLAQNYFWPVCFVYITHFWRLHEIMAPEIHVFESLSPGTHRSETHLNKLHSTHRV